MGENTDTSGPPCKAHSIHLGIPCQAGPSGSTRTPAAASPVGTQHRAHFPPPDPGTHSSLTPPARSARSLTRTHTAPRTPKAAHSAHTNSRFSTHARPNSTGHRVPCTTTATTPHSTPQFPQPPTRRPTPRPPFGATRSLQPRSARLVTRPASRSRALPRHALPPGHRLGGPRALPAAFRARPPSASLARGSLAPSRFGKAAAGRAGEGRGGGG